MSRVDLDLSEVPGWHGLQNYRPVALIEPWPAMLRRAGLRVHASQSVANPPIYYMEPAIGALCMAILPMPVASVTDVDGALDALAFVLWAWQTKGAALIAALRLTSGNVEPYVQQLRAEWRRAPDPFGPYHEIRFDLEVP